MLPLRWRTGVSALFSFATLRPHIHLPLFKLIVGVSDPTKAFGTYHLVLVYLPKRTSIGRREIFIIVQRTFRHGGPAS